MSLSADSRDPELFAALLHKDDKAKCCHALLQALLFATKPLESEFERAQAAEAADAAARGDGSLLPHARPPRWPFRAFVQTEDDISLLLPRQALELFPPGVLRVHAQPWQSVLVAKGAVPLSESRLVSALAVTLATARVPIFYFNTFSSSYVLVEQAQWAAAVAGLRDSLGIDVEYWDA